MSRRAPPSPDLAENRLDAALATLVPPALPAGLAARIVRDVPGLPQLAPLADDPAAGAARAPQSATVVALARRRRTWLLAGIGTGAGAAIAAGIAAVAMVGNAPDVLPGAPQQPVPAMAAAPVPGAAAAVAPDPRGADAAQLAAAGAPAVASHRAARKSAAGVLAAPADVAMEIAPDQPVALAEAAPVEAPAADGEAVPATAGPAPAPGPRGQMGPVLPQGMGYTGGVPGVAIPPSAPVQMSGGPR